MKSFRKLLANERGMILVISLLILALLLGAGVGAIVSMQTDLKTSSNLKTGKQAFYIADAGVNRAWREMDDGNGTNDFDSLSGTATLFTNVSYGGGSYTVTAEVVTGTPSGSPKRIKVTSTGCYAAVTGTGACPAGNAKVVIEAMFRRESVFNCGVCGKDSVALSGGAVVDSFDSRNGAYGGGNVGSDGDVGSNGTVTLTGSGTTVKGDATAVSTISTGAGTVTGTTTTPAAPKEFPSVSACSPYKSDTSGINPASAYNTSTHELKAGTGGISNVTLDNGTYCFKSVDLSGTGTLTVNGPVIIYVTDPSDFTGGGVVNTTVNPDNLKIFSSSTSTSPTGLKVAGGSSVKMAIYAPDASIDITGGSDFFGSVVGKTVTSTGGAKFHYDKKLEDNTDGEVGMVSWRQVF